MTKRKWFVEIKLLPHYNWNHPCWGIRGRLFGHKFARVFGISNRLWPLVVKLNSLCWWKKPNPGDFGI